MEPPPDRPGGVPVIDRFRGRYFFLSNYFPAPTPHRGRMFPTSEHAYMAAGTSDETAIQAIVAADTRHAQIIGRAARDIAGWEDRRFAIMDEIVTAKFAYSPALAGRLLATADARPYRRERLARPDVGVVLLR